MKISTICITNKNRAIGYKNQLLWNIPPDLEHFKKITAGHTVMMGDKTFESLGRPLPNRVNIVISLDKNYQASGCIVVHSIEEALERGKIEEKKSGNENEEIFIIGGGTIYKLMLPYSDKLYLTMVENEPKKVDTYFPDYSEFKNLVSESETREHNGLKYKFIELTRQSTKYK